MSDDAENAITVAPGANAHLRGDDLPPLDGVTHLLLQLETPIQSVTEMAQRARAAGVTVVLNAAPAQSLPRALLDAVDVLIVNEGELAAIAGPEPSMRDALERVGVPCVIVTLGDQGSCVRTSEGLFTQAAFPVAAVDTTAAGDTFCGALVAALSEGAALPAAVRVASTAAAIACTRLGAQPSIPTRDDVVAFLRSAG